MTEPSGTFACPICGLDTPHHHDDVDVLRWRQRTGQVALPDPGEVPLRCCVPHPELEGYFCSWALAHGGDNHVWWRFTPTDTELSWREALNRSRVDSPLAQEPAPVMEPDHGKCPACGHDISEQVAIAYDAGRDSVTAPAAPKEEA